jgi:hypothetical protein
MVRATYLLRAEMKAVSASVGVCDWRNTSVINSVLNAVASKVVVSSFDLA